MKHFVAAAAHTNICKILLSMISTLERKKEKNFREAFDRCNVTLLHEFMLNSFLHFGIGNRFAVKQNPKTFPYLLVQMCKTQSKRSLCAHRSTFCHLKIGNFHDFDYILINLLEMQRNFCLETKPKMSHNEEQKIHSNHTVVGSNSNNNIAIIKLQIEKQVIC